MTTKCCKICSTTKDASEFHKNAGATCKVCTRAKAREYGKTNSERLSEYHKAWRASQADRIKAVQQDYARRMRAEIKAAKQAYYLAHKEEIAAQKSVYKKANRAKFNAAHRARHFQKRRAIPSWSDKSAIEAIYLEASRLSNETGNRYHVDHIVPLKSKLVCGLHCEANLQILPASENISKGNHWWPDMPERLEHE